jgi:homoserine dehydrogenase
VADALARAQELGYAEPDASFDVSGRDAADKLVLLLRECAGVTFERSGMEVTGIEAITAADIDAARALGGTIKPVAHASIGDAVRAFVGPAFVPRSHPLAGVDDALNAVRLDGRYVGRLFFSGPGAGPDVTAATVLDDAVEVAVARGRSNRQPFREPAARLPVDPAESAWLVRVPSSDAARAATCLCEYGIIVDRAALEGAVILTGAADRVRLERALAPIATSRRDVLVLRAVEDT